MVGGPPLVEQHDRMLSLSVARLDLILGRLLPDGTRLRALGGLAGLRRDYRVPGRGTVPGRAMPPGGGGAFPERLLALFSQPPRQRFITGDGEEYCLCEVALRVPDPAAAWAELRGRCLPPPQRRIRDLPATGPT